MAIRVLIINRQLAFSVALKQALERTGAFDVHPFTTADAAVEYLQSHPQDVALLDFSSVAPNGASVVEALRRIQPGLALVASPQQSAGVMSTLQLQESIDPPFSARDVIPLLNRAVEQARQLDVDLTTRQLDEPSMLVPPTRPSGATLSGAGRTGADIPKQGDSAAPDRSRRLRPGEISDEQIRPYMYSTDLFKQRQEEAGTGAERRRPGEISEEDLKALRSTDIFKQPASEASEEQRQGSVDYSTDELRAPSTDSLRVPQSEGSGNLPPLERPTRRRTKPLESDTGDSGAPIAADPPTNVRPGEFSEQDLLNLALNRGALNEASDATPQTMRFADQAEGADAYRISTDIFKDNAEGTSALSAEDAAAMWEQLTREDTPVQPMSAVDIPSFLEASFEFESFDLDPDAATDTPVPVIDGIPAAAPSIADLLAAAEEEIHLPDEDEPYPGTPRSATDILATDIEEIELPNVEESFDFEAEDVFADDDILEQQYQVEGLFSESGEYPRISTQETSNARETSVGSEIQDEFEPPVLPEEMIAAWGQVQPPEDEPVFTEATPEDDPQNEMIDAGVAQLEALAEEIRRARESERFSVPPPPYQVRDATFEKLAAEEPPMPADQANNDTVGDLYDSVHDPGFQSVLQILRGEEVPESPQTSGDEAVASIDAELPPDPTIGTRSRLPIAGGIDQPTITQSEIDEIFSSFSRREVPRDAFSFEDVSIPSDSDSTPAQLILESALDESTPADTFSLPALIASIERQLEQHKPSVRPLPSWQRDETELRDDKYVREPDFLAGVIQEVDSLPQLDEVADTYGDATTFAGNLVEAAEDMETEYIPVHPTRPRSVPEMDWSIEPPITEEDTDGFTKPLEEMPAASELPPLEDQEPEFSTEFERLAAFNFGEIDEQEATPPMGMPAIQDPYITQIALSLTQVSLEEVAGAILTRENEVIAFAGRMGRSDIDEIRAAINDIWDTRSDQANIRFITLPSSGRDYMLYTRKTVNDLRLSLVFSNTTPLRDIRKQGKRLTEALMAVPEPAADGGAPAIDAAIRAAAQSDVRGVFTYVWMLRDPAQKLNNVVARAIETGMSVQLKERNWQILDLQVRDECVYLLADVPGEVPPYEVVRDLKRRAAEIARKQNPALGHQNLWADSYLVVAPGRELDEDEIQQFISFERMS